MKTKLFLNKYYLLFFLLFTTITIYSCSANEPEKDKSNFGIYLLEDASITWESLQGKDLSSYRLKEWITNEMIDNMDYSSHVFYLNVNYNTLLSVAHNDNTPFVVVANDKRCYIGRFGPPKDTTQPHVLFTPMALCTDLVMLEFDPPQRKDLRINDDVKSALKSLGKLRPGISLTFEQLIHSVFNMAGKYKPPFVNLVVHVYNNENDYIYCKGYEWDIIKAGNKTYESKLVFYNQTSCYSSPAIISPYDTLNYKKKTVLDPEKGYNWGFFCPFLRDGYVYEYFSFDVCSEHYIPADMPNGTYYCYLEYYGGMMGGDKTMRYTPKGRMWMGYMRSNTIQVKYDSASGFEYLNQNVVLP